MGELNELLTENGGVLRTGQGRQWNNRLEHWARAGRLHRVLPGVYVAAGHEKDVSILARAAAAYSPRSVIIGAAAATLTFWPQHPVAAVGVAGVRVRGNWPGFEFSERVIPRTHRTMIGEVSVSDPALTAVDLVGLSGDGAAYDEVLRRGVARWPDLVAALEATPHRRGNTARRILLADSRYGAFSHFERRAHRILRANGLTDWVANQPWNFRGRWYRPDVRFLSSRLILEFDGYENHSTRDAFCADRVRWRGMTLADHLVLPFSWRCMDDEPQFVREVRRGLRLAA